ncbi:murein L,D-transpeptidase catalytic domain family protein [Flavihumibacter fluvii]|uniref:murein L,D-transpeptidase catalytic domain family protein n=1 Tax=Flavihumibacter fluvii TaxID=2838157 RepID=UPI001BDE19AD|nr:murein L,D-transpeptidase catalytic domain family protein [Flavihumibacter fluvii]ULQ52225.1 murein L,D-transpeptidase catalytic domain family protein [Flavihumibacter fluvii]
MQPDVSLMINPKLKSALAGIFLFSSTLLPVNLAANNSKSIAGKSASNKKTGYKKATSPNKKNFKVTNSFSVNAGFSAQVMQEADSMYKQLNLAEKGLSKKAFIYGWKGYRILQKKGFLQRSEVLSICDFSQSSRHKRLYIIDVEQKVLLVNTFVAHGRNSGGEFARQFSNKPQSRQSSLGFYVTRQTYFGEHGLSLRIDGIERGFNDRANARNIVVHGSDYLGGSFLENNPFNGRSYGCPAVPGDESQYIIDAIKNGTCMFIYHPTKKYLSTSRIINA